MKSEPVRSRILTAALLTVLTLPGSGAAQDSGRAVSLALDRSTGRASLLIGDVLGEPRLEDALQSGLPLRVRVELQLWRDGFFDRLEGEFEWRMDFLSDPLGSGLVIAGPGPPPLELVAASLEAARGRPETRVEVPIHPRESGRYYYLGWVEVETLSLSDLEELQRWLEGELGPAVRGEGDVDDAFTRGIGRLLVRALGLPTRRIRIRSPEFRYVPEGS